MRHNIIATPTQATVTITATVAELQKMSRAIMDAAWILERVGNVIYYMDDRTVPALEAIDRIIESAETECYKARCNPARHNMATDAAPGAPRYPYDNGDGDGS